MQEHEQRVVDEHAELQDKAGKLDTFLNGNFYKTLPKEDQELLAQQSIHMQAYLHTLECRIARFK